MKLRRRMQARDTENDMFEHSGLESMKHQDFTEFPGMESRNFQECFALAAR